MARLVKLSNTFAKQARMLAKRLAIGCVPEFLVGSLHNKAVQYCWAAKDSKGQTCKDVKLDLRKCRQHALIHDTSLQDKL